MQYYNNYYTVLCQDSFGILFLASMNTLLFQVIYNLVLWS